jgi:hypothetical protein
LRVLVSFDDTHRSYRTVIARALSEVRPHLEVRQASLDELDAQLRFFEPHVVVCSLPNGKPSPRRPASVATTATTKAGAWIMAPIDTSQPAEVCLDGEHWKTDGPPLSELLKVIDETEARLQEGSLEEGC